LHLPSGALHLSSCDLECAFYFVQNLPTSIFASFKGTPEARYFEEGLVEDFPLPYSLGGGDYAEFALAVARDALAEMREGLG